MSSLSLRRALRCASAVAMFSLIAAAPADSQQPQPTAHDSTKSGMPANMKMGTPATKKKSAKTSASAAAKKTTRKTGSKTRPAATRKTTATKKTTATGKTTAMPGMKMGGAQPSMPSHADSAHQNAPVMPAMPGMPATSVPHHDTSAAGIKGMEPAKSPNLPGLHGHSTDDMMTGPASVSMERMGSGTTWIPDAVTMPSRLRMLGGWMIMTHGFAFLQYDKQSGERGEDQFGSLNWAMLMATRDLAGGKFQARTMLSLDALTVTNRGYPLLLQTGESFDGQPLHDRQHPHDFWMELGVLYQRPITKSLAWSIYAAPSGEPALSPVAFMHRPSAMDNLTAPLGHHWQDATHVSFGVLTGGIFTHTWQLEGSIFNGREPDQHRWDFDPIKLDSYSGRFTLNPSAHWSFEGGYGYLKSPEELSPAESIHRITASAQHGTTLGTDGQVATTFIWAANKHSTTPALSHSLLLESEAILDRSNTVFGRTELVQKSADELVVTDPVTTSKGVLLAGFPANTQFNVGAAQLGYIREVSRTRWATIGLGGAATLNFVPAPLEPYYGSRTPLGAFVFLRLRPFHSPRKGEMNMGGMKMDKHE